MTDVKPSRGIVGSKQNSSAKRKKKNKSGIGSSFCAGLLSKNNVADEDLQRCMKAYEEALLAAGFAQKLNAHRTRWNVSVMASSSFEVKVSLDERLQIKEMSERPLSWVHATIINNRTNEGLEA